jgi:hypothetical protein
MNDKFTTNTEDGGLAKIALSFKDLSGQSSISLHSAEARNLIA